MQAQVQLTRFQADPGALPGQRQGYPITIQASGTNIPSEIFVYRVGKLGDAFPGDQFSCVASVVQLDEIPAIKAVTLTREVQIPFYRTSQMELICRTAAEADQVWNIVQEDVAALVANYELAYCLKGNVTATISNGTISTSTNDMTPPTRIQLEYQPAGTATYVSSVQGITSPDISLPGWLPVSQAFSGWSVPPGALFFYNIAQDANLQSIWPLPQPYSGQELYRNGVLLPYGIVYVIDQNTIWWLNFDPTTIPNYARIAGQVADGNAPWPTDYVSPASPGAVSSQIILMAFA
jgi:hypothetical protein